MSDLILAGGSAVYAPTGDDDFGEFHLDGTVTLTTTARYVEPVGTFDFWLKTTTIGTGLVIKFPGTDANGWFFSLALDGTPFFQPNGYGKQTVAPSVGTVNVADGAWHHLAVTVDNSTRKANIFVDGVGYGDPGELFFLSGLAFPDGFVIGGGGFVGQIADVRISNTVRWTDNFDPGPHPSNALDADLDYAMVAYWSLAYETSDRASGEPLPINLVGLYDRTLTASTLYPVVVQPVGTEPVHVRVVNHGSGELFALAGNGDVALDDPRATIVLPNAEASLAVPADNPYLGLISTADTTVSIIRL